MCSIFIHGSLGSAGVICLGSSGCVAVIPNKNKVSAVVAVNSPKGIKKASHFISHTGVWINSYQQYLKWGSIAQPGYTVGLWILNWAFWFTMFYLIGGPGLPCALFGGALFSSGLCS